jgi:ribulose-5-phosphate 4-epimerase/fuculose-1-phosphate aldolase
MKDDALWQARVDLAAAFRLAVTHKFHEGICNHFSLAVPGTTDRFLVNPYGYHFSEITASSLLLVDTEGNIIEGDGILEKTAFYIHSRIHRMQPNARCVLHTHQPYATTLTVLQHGRLEPISQNALYFYDKIAYDENYNGLALDTSEGDRIAAVMGDKPVCFLGNHGVIVTGPTVASAFDDLYYLERACELQVLALSTRQPLRCIDPELAMKTRLQMEGEKAQGAELHFKALKRLLDRSQPDYAS